MGDNCSELAKKFSDEGDIISAVQLAENLTNEGKIAEAERILGEAQNYIDAWKDVAAHMPDISPPIDYNFTANRWFNSDTGLFVTSPTRDENFLQEARNRGLIDI